VQTNRFLRFARSRPRLLLAIALGVAVAAFLPHATADQPVTRALLAWNAGTLLYLVLAGVMMARSNEESMQRRARREDEGRYVVLVLVVVAVVASLAAIGGQLVVVKDVHGWPRFLHIALAGLTVLTSWAFMHIVFALHYAHDFYGALTHGRHAGLEFPGNEKPDYADFFYFAAIIGTSGQTADVSLTSRSMRRLGTVHCILSFFFNTIVLALTINIAASLI
jgi:uncharacterized membrane protein